MNIFVSFVQWSPLASILIFSFAITALLSFAYKKLTNQKDFDKFKKEQEELRKEMNEHKNDPEKLAEVQKKMLQNSSESMKISFKPMIITFVPVMIALWLLKRLYVDIAQINNIIPWDFHIAGLCDWSATAGVCNGAGWLLCYVVFSLIFSFVLRKVFKLQ
jgi:uncharacterized membrane protein (DUF106 family)